MTQEPLQLQHFDRLVEFEVKSHPIAAALGDQGVFPPGTGITHELVWLEGSERLALKLTTMFGELQVAYQTFYLGKFEYLGPRLDEILLGYTREGLHLLTTNILACGLTYMTTRP